MSSFVKCLFYSGSDLNLLRAPSRTEKDLSCVVVRIMLLKTAWCIIWVHLNACERLRGCLEVAFLGDLCVLWMCL